MQCCYKSHPEVLFLQNLAATQKGFNGNSVPWVDPCLKNSWKHAKLLFKHSLFSVYHCTFSEDVTFWFCVDYHTLNSIKLTNLSLVYDRCNSWTEVLS